MQGMIGWGDPVIVPWAGKGRFFALVEEEQARVQYAFRVGVGLNYALLQVPGPDSVGGKGDTWRSQASPGGGLAGRFDKEQVGVNGEDASIRALAAQDAREKEQIEHVLVAFI